MQRHDEEMGRKDEADDTSPINSECFVWNAPKHGHARLNAYTDHGGLGEKAECFKNNLAQC